MSQVVPLFTKPRRTPQRGAAERAFLPAALEVLETPTSPTVRVTAGLISAFLLGASLWSYFGHVDIVTTAPGKVIVSSRTKVVQPFDTGIVHAIHVADGDRVTQGQLLIELDPALSTADRTRYADELAQARLDQARLNALVKSREGDPFAGLKASDDLAEAARARLEAQRRAQSAKLAGLDRVAAQKRAEAAGTDAEIAKIDATLPLVRARAAIRENGLKTEFGNRLDFLAQQQQVVELEHERVVDLRKREEIDAALAEVAEQRAQAEAEFRGTVLSDLAKADHDAGEAAGELAKAEKRTAMEALKAPEAGVIQDLAVNTIGGVVTPAQQLLRIVPTEGSIEVEAVIANEDVGFVEAGQEAEIKVDAFPFTRYGLIRGHVREIAHDSVDQPQAEQRRQGSSSASDEPASVERSRQLVYMARIALEATNLQVDDRKLDLVPGMSITAEIKTGRRRVLDYFLSPFQSHVHDALRER